MECTADHIDQMYIGILLGALYVNDGIPVFRN